MEEFSDFQSKYAALTKSTMLFWAWYSYMVLPPDVRPATTKTHRMFHLCLLLCCISYVNVTTRQTLASQEPQRSNKSVCTGERSQILQLQMLQSNRQTKRYSHQPLSLSLSAFLWCQVRTSLANPSKMMYSNFHDSTSSSWSLSPYTANFHFPDVICLCVL